MDSFFPELAALIFKAGVFPNATVLVYTANFLELYVLVSLAAIKEGFPFNIRAVDQVLTPEKTCYYSNNNMRVNEYAAPFGENLCVDSNYDDWAESLKVGDKVDAIKAQSALTDAKMIWSRGVVTGVRPYYVTVAFYGENQTSLTDKFIKKTPYNLNKYGTRSVDFEWRENLKEGDTFDLYLGKRGWMLFTVESVITQWQEREIYKFVQASYKATSDTPRSAAGEEDTPISKLNSYQAITVNVHDPVLRKPNTYSPLRYVGWQYCNDEVYEVCDPNIVAVTRIKGETDMMAPIVNSRYYLRFVNVFALQGGFEMMKKIFLWREPPCSAQLVGYFMNIMANVAPFLLNRFVQKEGIVFAEAAFKYVIESPVENLRNLSKEIVEAIYKGFDQLAKRIYSQEKAKEKSEDFLLKVASIFMSTDNLERKLHGVTILADIYKKIKAKEFEKVTKKDLATLIEKDGLIEQIIKGHTQLITKSTELFKLMFEEGRMNEKNLQLLWTTMRKADLETKNALGAMLNEAFVEFSYSQSAYFLTKLSELEAKQITLDDIELAFKIATYFKSKPGDAAEGIKSLDVEL
jgi:CTP:phosphocholine cytidylyltransferase-like protein